MVISVLIYIYTPSPDPPPFRNPPSATKTGPSPLLLPLPRSERNQHGEDKEPSQAAQQTRSNTQQPVTQRDDDAVRSGHRTGAARTGAARTAVAPREVAPNRGGSIVGGGEKTLQ